LRFKALPFPLTGDKKKEDIFFLGPGKGKKGIHKVSENQTPDPGGTKPVVDGKESGHQREGETRRGKKKRNALPKKRLRFGRARHLVVLMGGGGGGAYRSPREAILP